MICKFCGNEIAETAKFCRGCGASRDEALDIISEPAPDEPIVQQPVSTYETVYDENPVIDEQLEEKKEKAETIIESVYGGIFPVINNDNDDNNQSNPDENNYEKEDKKPFRKRPFFLISFLCFIFMFVAFIVELALGTVITLRFTTSENVIKKAVDEFDIASVELDVDGETKTFAEAILDEVKTDDVSEAEVEELISEFQADEYFSEVIVDLTSYMFYGGEAPQLDGAELAEVIEDNKDTIEDITGEEISDADIDEFKKSADDMVADFNESIKEFEVAEQANEITSKFDINLTIYVLSGVLLGIILILVLCYKLNGSGVYRVFKAFMTPTFISGFIFVFIGVVVPKIAKEAVTGDNSDVIIRLLSSFATFPLYAGIILMAVFVVSLVLYIVFKIIYNKTTRTI